MVVSARSYQPCNGKISSLPFWGCFGVLMASSKGLACFLFVFECGKHGSLSTDVDVVTERAVVENTA